MSEAADGDRDEDVPLAANSRHPPGDTAQRACPHCEDGVVWEQEATGEYICDSCHVSLDSGPRVDLAAQQQSLREQRHAYSRGEYDRSGRARLIGGYRHAYLSSNGAEYAIDAYDTETDGLLTPHKRDWAY